MRTGIQQRMLFIALFLLSFGTLMAQKTVTGTVVDNTNLPAIGVNVVIKGTTNGTITDLDGKYSIDVRSNEDILVFSMVGMTTEEIVVGDRNVIDVSMVEDLMSLDEVVVVGYGVMKKSDVTGAVSSVSAEDIQAAKTNNAVEALQGKVSGVDMTRTSGEAGSGFNILVRGARSLTASNEPIYIVDGVDYGSNINISPNDIESMEVLKDASSTAIYGSRGANGIILITTKKGTKNKPMISFNTYYGVTSPLGHLELENSEQYIQRVRDIKRYSKDALWDVGDFDVDEDGELIINPITSLSRDQLIGYENGTDFDWLGEQMEDHGTQQDYHLSISGGNENTTYAVSVNNFIEDGFIPKDYYKRYSIKSNINSKVNDFFEFGNSTFIAYSNRSRAVGLNPHLMPLVTPYDSLGNLVAIPDQGHVPFQNPLIDQDPDNRYHEIYNTKVFSTFYAQATLAQGLTFRSSFNVNLNFNRDGDYTGEVDGLSRVNSATLNNSNNYGYTWTNILTYDKTFGDHHLMFTGATETIYDRTERFYLYGQEFEQRPGTLWYTISSSTGDLTAVGGDLPLEEYQKVSFIGRIHYGFQGKYLLTATGRRDGASQLREKWDFFPSASLAWRVSEEDFLKGNPMLSNLKFRFGYGVVGNESSPAYKSLGSINSDPMYYEFGDSDGGVLGYYTNQLDTSPRWEKTSAINLGLDFGLFANRISGSLELYKSHTYDLLQLVKLPPTSAVSEVLENIGETEGKGVELSLSTVNVQTSDLNWSTDFTFSAAREEITYLNEGVTQDIANGWFVGSPITVYYDLEKVGIWQRDDILSEEEAANYGITRMKIDTDNDGTNDAVYRAQVYGAYPGEIKFDDANNDTAITEDGDRKILGTPRPKWTGGVKSSLSYKNFDFSFFVYARIGQTIYDTWSEQWAPDGRERSIVRDYWTPSNPTNAYPTVDGGLTRAGWPEKTTLAYTDGSFIKVKDITIGYSLPSKVLETAKISSLRIYASAKNYIVISKLFNEGRYDIEAVNREGRLSTGFPVPKMISVGANVTF